MPEFNQGQTLSDWHIEIWFKLLALEKKKWKIIGYFRDKKLAEAIARRGGFWGENGKIKPVKVITQDGDTAYIISTNHIQPDDETLRAEAIAYIIPKLDQDDLIILGIEVETVE